MSPQVLLTTQGIRPETVIESTRRGNDTENYPTKEKVYYRLQPYPKYGVLLLHETVNAPIATQYEKLNVEANNFQRLRAIGFDVPEILTPAILVEDHLKNGIHAAALVVEHIDGSGPYKPKTEHRSIRTIVHMSDDNLKSVYLIAWGRLSDLIANGAPRDHQVILGSTGRIVTIDPEASGQGYNLPPIA